MCGSKTPDEREKGEIHGAKQDEDVSGRFKSV